MEDDSRTTVMVFIGWGQKDGAPDYGELIRRLEELRYKVELLPIKWGTWAKPTMYRDWVDQVAPVCLKARRGRRVIFVGFSVGVLLALAMAAEQMPDGLLLLSPTIWVPEAIAVDKIWEVGTPEIPDLMDSLAVVSVRTLAMQVTGRVRVAVGTEEGPAMNQWAAVVAWMLRAGFDQIPGANHDPLGPAYLDYIIGVLSSGDI
jgi:hypothetical protein